jgi:hypothetical protein
MSGKRKKELWFAWKFYHMGKEPTKGEFRRYKKDYYK